MKRNIVFATIPIDYSVEKQHEVESQWFQFVNLSTNKYLQIDKLILFVNPVNKKHIKKFYTFLKKNMAQTRIKFISVIKKSAFNIDDITPSYGFFCAWFNEYPFDTKNYDYFFYFSRGNIFSHTFMLIMLINMHQLPCRILHLRRNIDNSSIPWRIEIYDAHIGKWIADIGRYERETYHTQSFLKSCIPTNNDVFNKLICSIEHVALHSTAPILLLGPTGSGKSQLARRIYELRKKIGRVRGAFVSINCATLHGESAHSTLFGHIRGAFTGAQTDRRGLLKTADGGVLFLDEVGELSLELQAQLLKAIEEKSYLPLGADTEVTSNFQLICATNRLPDEDVGKGLFRQDLYARINLWEFRLPGLCERIEDIEPNLDYELRRLREEKGLFANFTTEARKAYLDFAVSPEASWPDNFRSLMASMERMVTYSLTGTITLKTVSDEIAYLKSRWHKKQQASPTEKHPTTPVEQDRFPLQNSLARAGKIAPAHERDLFEAVQLEEVLTICRQCSTRSEAGRRLFAVSRLNRKSIDDTIRLNKYLKNYGLSWHDTKTSERKA